MQKNLDAISQIIINKLLSNGWAILGLIVVFFGLLLLVIAVVDTIKLPFVEIKGEDIGKHINRKKASQIACIALLIGTTLVVPSINSPTQHTINTPSPAPTQSSKLVISGSTSMASYIKSHIDGFKNTSGVDIKYIAKTSDLGIYDLTYGVDGTNIAACSRPLRENEKTSLEASLVSQDDIAVVIGTENRMLNFLLKPEGGLTKKQLKLIFQGTYQNWSDIGGSDKKIKVYNRPEGSGTRSVFQQIVLDGEDFGSTSNIITVSKDGVTDWIYKLKEDGIGYASAKDVTYLNEVRPIVVNKLEPGMGGYPIRRSLFYAYKKEPIDSNVKRFIDYVSSQNSLEKGQ